MGAKAIWGNGDVLQAHRRIHPMPWSQSQRLPGYGYSGAWWMYAYGGMVSKRLSPSPPLWKRSL
jgi:hypothetical protein